MKTTLCTVIGTAAVVIGLSACDTAPPVDPAVPGAADAMQAAEPGVNPGSDLSYEALVELIGDPDEFAKARKLGALLPTLGPEALPAVKDALEQAAALEMGALEFELLMRYWASFEPADAGYYALAVAPRGYRVAAIYAAVIPWAKANPQEALESARVWTREPGDGGAAAQIALVRGWYESEQPGLEQYIRDLGAGFERQRALLAYSTARVRKHGADDLMRWAEATAEVTAEDDATYKLELYRNAASALVPFDVAAAQRFCDAHCEGPDGSNLRNTIANRWARDDAAAALEWLATAPNGQETGLAVRTAYAVWGNKDREAAVRWMKAKIAGGEPEAWLRSTFAIHARLLGKDSPAEGLAFAAGLEDEKEREWVSGDIAREWRQKDEAAAEAWLRESSLSEETLERVRAPENGAERVRREELEKIESSRPGSDRER